jgi:prolyl 4-hydroxylase
MKEVLLTTPDQPCFIGAWYLPNISICDDIVRVFNTDFFTKAPGELGGPYRTRVDKTEKDSLDANLRERPDLANQFTANLLAVLEQYKQKFFYADKVDVYCVEALNIQQYPKGGGYPAWHAERQGNNTRHLVWMTYLNDIEEGGETEFFYQKLKVKPRKGLTLIWPVDWTHTHKGNICLNEEKMIITGWFNFFEKELTPEEADSLKKIKPAAA